MRQKKWSRDERMLDQSIRNSEGPEDLEENFGGGAREFGQT